MSEAVLRTEKLRKVYISGFRRRRHVGLDGLDLEVRKGEVLGYVGPNGAGKTSTLKLLMGLNTPTSGRGEIFGQPLGCRAVRSRIGYLPEHPYFYSYLSGEEFLNFYGQLFGMSRGDREARIRELLALVDLEGARKVQLRKYSKGMLQRIGLAQALINRPELVLLDEPSSGLDPMGRRLIRDIIVDLRDQGTTVLFSSHILSDVEQVCDRVAVLVGGRLREVATVEELVQRQAAQIEVSLQGLEGEALDRLDCSGTITHGPRGVRLLAQDQDEANRIVRHAIAAGAQVTSLVPRRQGLEGLLDDEQLPEAGSTGGEGPAE